MSVARCRSSIAPVLVLADATRHATSLHSAVAAAAVRSSLASRYSTPSLTDLHRGDHRNGVEQ